MDKQFDIIVVGGGLVGLSAAFKIQQKSPSKKILLIEKENELSSHQSGRNSGVIHSGLYYQTGSLRASNCVTGRHALVTFAKKHNISHDVCGKLVVATNQKELNTLPNLLKRGRDNGLQNLSILNSNEMKEIEPFVTGMGAILVPETGIIDYRQMAEKLASLIQLINPKSKILKNTEVLDFENNSNYSTVITNKHKYKCQNIIVCGGLFSDRLAKKDNLNLDMKIVGFRGDYYTLSDSAKHKVQNLIYPVPNPEFPFLGVHFTRMTNGEIECGPNAVFTFKREGYQKGDFNLRDTFDALSYFPTWRLFFKHWKFGIDEMKRSYSKRLFLNQLKRIIPSLSMDDIQPGRSGVRAMSLGKNGEIIDDFRIINQGKNIHVLNAPSPAATACLSIGSEILNKYKKSII